jgi:hypothetical protein
VAKRERKPKFEYVVPIRLGYERHNRKQWAYNEAQAGKLAQLWAERKYRTLTVFVDAENIRPTGRKFIPPPKPSEKRSKAQTELPLKN